MERLSRRESRHSAGWRGLGRILGLKDYLRSEGKGAFGIGGRVLRAEYHYRTGPRHVGHTAEYQEAKRAADAANKLYLQESVWLREWLEATGPDDRVIARTVPGETERQSGSPQVLAIQLGKHTPDVSWREQPAVRLCVTTDLPLGDEAVGTDTGGTVSITEDGAFNTFYLLKLADGRWREDREYLERITHSEPGQWEFDQKHISARHADERYAISRAGMLRGTRALIENSVPRQVEL